MLNLRTFEKTAILVDLFSRDHTKKKVNFQFASYNPNLRSTKCKGNLVKKTASRNFEVMTTVHLMHKADPHA